MHQEVWKPIEGFESYSISSFGRVYSKKTNKILRAKLNINNYYCVVLCDSGKITTKRVNRLVAIAFIPNSLNKSEVNHKDGNKTNNNINNLEWVTHKENIIHARDVLGICKDKPVIGIHIKTGEQIQFKSTMEAGRNGFNSGNISSCCNKKPYFKTHKNYIWKYD
jgi:hypothetical protein